VISPRHAIAVAVLTAAVAVVPARADAGGQRKRGVANAQDEAREQYKRA